jgi:hypothetical protein
VHLDRNKEAYLVAAILTNTFRYHPLQATLGVIINLGGMMALVL